MPAKSQKRTQQQTLGDAGLAVARYPPLANPADDVGHKLMVPSTHWAITDGEHWECTILDFEADHKFARKKTLVPAFKLFEISNEETFWIIYPDPYLMYRHSPETKLLCPDLFTLNGTSRACRRR